MQAKCSHVMQNFFFIEKMYSLLDEITVEIHARLQQVWNSENKYDFHTPVNSCQIGPNNGSTEQTKTHLAKQETLTDIKDSTNVLSDDVALPVWL